MGSDNRLVPGGWFANVSRALQNILSKFVCCRNRTSYGHFKLKLCSCAQSKALGTRTNFQLEILTINVITGIVYIFARLFWRAPETLVKQPPGLSNVDVWWITCTGIHINLMLVVVFLALILHIKIFSSITFPKVQFRLILYCKLCLAISSYVLWSCNNGPS